MTEKIERTEPDLGISQLKIDSSIYDHARRAFGDNPNPPDEIVETFEKRLETNGGFDLNRVLCLFASVGVAINHLFGERIVGEKQIINSVAYAISHDRSQIEKDPNPKDRYYYGIWRAFNRIGFYHQAAIPLAEAYGCKLLSVVFSTEKEIKSLSDLLAGIKVEKAAVCVSVSNIEYLKARFKDHIKIENEKIFYPARINGKIEYVELIRDSHLIFIRKNDNGGYEVYDSFNIPISEEFDAPLSYETDEGFLNQFLTGKALIITLEKAELKDVYEGEIVPIKIPLEFRRDIDKIRR